MTRNSHLKYSVGMLQGRYLLHIFFNTILQHSAKGMRVVAVELEIYKIPMMHMEISAGF